MRLQMSGRMSKTRKGKDKSKKPVMKKVTWKNIPGGYVCQGHL